MRRWRGLKSLVHDAVDATTELVREGHESAARAVLRVTDQVEPIAAPARVADLTRRLSTDGLLATIRTVNRAVELLTDAGLDVAERFGAGEATEPPAVPLRSDVTGSASWIGDAMLGLVNGAIGDRLHERENGLDLEMRLRAGDGYLDLKERVNPPGTAPSDDPTVDPVNDPGNLSLKELASSLPDASGRIALFVHGLATTEWSWCLEAQSYHGDPAACFGSLLERDLGYTPVYVRYNSGRHVSENGRDLAYLLNRLMAAWPVDVTELLLIGHSMGGLVVRSACHYGGEAGLGWVTKVKRVICLGTPHHGAPLAKLGHLLTGVLGAIDLPGTLIPARILDGRSAGIRDLRHGALVDEEWLERDPDAAEDMERPSVPLLPQVSYAFFSATVTRDPAHPLGQLVGDLMVRPASSRAPRVTPAPATVTGTATEGRAEGPVESHFPIATAEFGGVLHHQLQNHPAVYEQIRRLCAAG